MSRQSKAGKYVIIGASAAGASAAEILRKYDQKAQITLISDERFTYSKPLLSYYLAGKLSEEQILWRAPDFYERNKIETIFGVRAVEIEQSKQHVVLEDGRRVSYDQLLLAAGAAPRFPSLVGLEKAGFFGLRKLADAQNILALLPRARRAVILGGGLVGLKTAEALKRRGLEVTVLVDSPHVLSQMLDESAARIFEKIFAENGVRIHCRTRPAALLGTECVTGVKLGSGEEFPADLVIAGKGVDANLDLAKKAGLPFDYAIAVDDYLRTNIENIYAAGDVAQAKDVLRGEPWVNALWPCAVEQGRIAALNMLGKRVVYRGSMRMNSVQFFGLPVISAGLAVLTPGPLGGRMGEHDETLELQPAPAVYRKIFLKDDTLVGFVLLGGEMVVEAAGLLKVLLERRVDVSPIKEQLIELGPDIGRLLPLVAANRERFVDREFQELIQSVGV